MAGRSRKQSWEEKLLELSAGGGIALGLMSAAASAANRPARVCHPTGPNGKDCAANLITGALAPYFKGAAIGGVTGVLLGLLVILTWKYMRGASSGPFARRPQPAAAVREAIPERVRHEVWRRDRGICVDCGSRARLEFDHIIPVSRGGSNTARNLEIRCQTCNRAKGATI